MTTTPRPDPPPAFALGATPVSNSGVTPADMELLRLRRDHLRAVYFQQESRAQVMFGLAAAVGGALIGSFGGKATELAQKGSITLWIVLGLCCGFLVLAFLLGLAVVLPLAGRHFLSQDHWLDCFLTRIGFHFACRPQSDRQKPNDEDDTLAQAARKLLSRPAATSSDFHSSTMSDPIFRAELYNLWALWYASVRKAGLLRLAMLLFAFGLLTALPSYLMVKEELATKQPSVTTKVQSPSPEVPGCDSPP